MPERKIRKKILIALCPNQMKALASSLNLFFLKRLFFYTYPLFDFCLLLILVYFSSIFFCFVLRIRYPFEDLLNLYLYIGRICNTLKFVLVYYTFFSVISASCHWFCLSIRYPFEDSLEFALVMLLLSIFLRSIFSILQTLILFCFG